MKSLLVGESSSTRCSLFPFPNFCPNPLGGPWIHLLFCKTKHWLTWPRFIDLDWKTKTKAKNKNWQYLQDPASSYSPRLGTGSEDWLHIPSSLSQIWRLQSFLQALSHHPPPKSPEQFCTVWFPIYFIIYSNCLCNLLSSILQQNSPICKSKKA